jgi:DNA primase catalytic subunit
MSSYFMPLGMRPATLEERKEFYTSEFDGGKLGEWLKMRRGKTKFAVIIGRHTRIFPEAYREDADTTIIIDEYQTLNDVQAEILGFLPEAAYYDRNIYNQKGKATEQELAFDLDPENVTCPIHGTLADRLKRGQGLSFCELELEIVKGQTVGLWEFLEGRFSGLRVVYSGRGFHVHVFDEAANRLSRKQRRGLAEEVKARGFDIDAWVTEGEMRLIRLPYSLHGLVSRIAIPLQKNEVAAFNPVNDPRCIPRFLQGKTATF